MTFNILHLNIERSKHTEAVLKLLQEKKPHIVCFVEAMKKDVEMISSKLGYEYVFSPRVNIKENHKTDEEGTAILSKYPIKKIDNYNYDDNVFEKIPTQTVSDMDVKNGERPKDRFLESYKLLVASIQISKEKNITVSTTHFPVTDHTTPGHEDHDIKSLQNVDDLEHADILLDKLINIIRSLAGPVIFTSDFNNPRGEYVYDTLAHELVDQVPAGLKSSIDPILHRVKGLELLVDTVMTSSDILIESFEVIEGVSDHKAFFVSMKI